MCKIMMPLLASKPGKKSWSFPGITLPCQDPAGALWRNARSVQWGPWAEVGMAVQANTLGRAKSMGCSAENKRTKKNAEKKGQMMILTSLFCGFSYPL